MAERKPLVLIGSQVQELPIGDTIPGAGGATYPSFTGEAGKVLAVNIGETDVEWVAQSAGGGGISIGEVAFQGARKAFTAWSPASATTYEQVSLAAAAYDTLGFEATNQFVIPAGVTRVRLTAIVVQMTGSANNQFRFYKNGSRITEADGGITGEVATSGYGTSGDSMVSGAVSVVEGDTLSLWNYDASAASTYDGFFELEVLEGSAIIATTLSGSPVNLQQNFADLTVVNGGFESGDLTGWTVGTAGASVETISGSASETAGLLNTTDDGTYMVDGGAVAYSDIYQDIDISSYSTALLFKVDTKAIKDFTDFDSPRIEVQLLDVSDNILSSYIDGLDGAIEVAAAKKITILAHNLPGAVTLRIRLMFIRVTGTNNNSAFSEVFAKALTPIAFAPLLPAGGTADQVLAKIDGTDYNVEWVTPSAGSSTEIEINSQTGTTYTFILTDTKKLITADNAAAQTFTIPDNATTAFPVGTVFSLKGIGAGEVTFTVDGTDTLNGVAGGSAVIVAAWKTVTFTKISSTGWAVDGAHGVIA